MDETLLLKADAVIDAEYPDVHSLLVIRHDYIVFERYYCGYDQFRRHQIRSITKSFISALVGIALKEGYLSSLDQKIADLLPEYFDSKVDSQKNIITLHHLLTMTSGLEGDVFDSFYWTMTRNSDWTSAVLGLPMQSEPGASCRAWLGSTRHARLPERCRPQSRPSSQP